MKHRLVGMALAGLFSAAAQAAAPTASITTSGVSFAEYTGSAVIGVGSLEVPVLYFVDEKSGPLGDAWYIFFEPSAVSPVNATITFSSAITSVLTSRSAVDDTTPTYGATGINYGSAPLNGLELKDDSATFSGNTLTISWKTNNPGDHVRVFTSAVPEPSTVALLGIGLVAVAFAARRRRAD